MTALGLGDLAQTFLLRRETSQARQQADRSALELSTGLAADVSARVGGDFSLVADLERQLRMVEAEQGNARQTALLAEAMQTALGSVQAHSADLAGSLRAAAKAGNGLVDDAASRDAAARLQAMGDALGVSVGGRFAFSGAATDAPPLSDAHSMMGALRASVAGLTDPADIAAAVRRWFTEPSGGFESLGYLGADQPATAAPLGQGERVALDIRADDPALRAVFAATALGAMAADPGLGLPVETRKGLLAQAAVDMTSAQDGITGMRARLGVAEAQIEGAQARLAAQKTAAETARLDLLGVDRYESATRLEEAQARLETLYTVTARLSRLSLAGRL